MQPIQHSNYALVSPRNSNYVFFLKSPKLTANKLIFFDEMNPSITWNDKPQLYPMTYYHLKYIIINKKKATIQVTEAKVLGCVGEEWKSDIFLEHMRSFQGSFKQPQANCEFMREFVERGEVRVNDEGWVYIKSAESGFRKKLKLVNSPFAVPLLKGCKVQYFMRKYAKEENPKVKISGITFRPLKLAGFLKMINDRIFFQPRHIDYERMLPLAIPEQLENIIEECLPRFKGSLPYSIFKRYQGSYVELNKKLSCFVLQGKFIDWPISFSHPVIEIEGIEPMSCSTLKVATLYEFGIPLVEYDNEERKLSDEIVSNFPPESIANRWKVPERCYSFDCQGGSCYDDAFSFKKTASGYQIGIHIADVPELIKQKPYLLKRALSRDQTIYIKNFYRSMFPEPLRNIMSLEADKPRLTFSLIFEVSEEGVISYDSLQLKESMVKVTENIKHGEQISLKDDRELVSSLLISLRKCRQLENMMVFNQTQTATMTSQLLYLSSYLPMVALKRNLESLPSITKITKQSIAQLCKTAETIVNRPTENTNFDTSSKPQKQVMKEEGEKTSSRKNESQSDQKPQKEQKVTSPQKTSKMEQTSLDSSQNGIPKEQKLPENYDYSLENSKPIEMRQSPNRQTNQKNEFLRQVSSKQGSAAECSRFLDKLFKAAGQNVSFASSRAIEFTFKECENKYKDKIATLYFRAKLIMSRQHFAKIAELHKIGHLRHFESISACPGPIVDSPQKKIISEKSHTVTPVIPEVEKIEVNVHQEKMDKKEEQRSQSLPNTMEKTGKQGQKEGKTVELSTQQNQISEIYNILSFISDANLKDFVSLSKKNLLKRICQLLECAKKQGLTIVKKEGEEQQKSLNDHIMKLLKKQAKETKLDVEPMKWNTPIRSGASLEAMILLKNHSWIFEGSLLPSKLIAHREQMHLVEEQINFIMKKRNNQQSLEMNNRIKEASRELAKIDFLYDLRQQPNKVWDFITITSPSQKVQFVYHEFIEEIEVDNFQNEVTFYTRVKGRFIGFDEFPIKLKVVLVEAEV